LLLHDELTEWLRNHLDVRWLQHPGIRQIIARRFGHPADQPWPGAAVLLTQLEDLELRGLVSQILAESRRLPSPEQQLADTVLRLRNQAIEGELAAVHQRTHAPDLGDSEQAELLLRLQRLRVAKAQPLHPLGEA